MFSMPLCLLELSIKIQKYIIFYLSALDGHFSLNITWLGAHPNKYLENEVKEKSNLSAWILKLMTVYEKVQFI